MHKIITLFFLFIGASTVMAQTGVDTLHVRKVYYMGGTGLSFPMGKTKEALNSKLFSGSLGLDISLKNPKYFLMPTLYMLTFGYNQLVEDPDYNHMIENGRANFYMLSLAAGTRRQYDRLNSYAYLGPTIGLISEPRGNVVDHKIMMENKSSISPAVKLGIGSDYKFKGFFLGGEIGYMYNFKKIQGNPVHFMTIMFGLKSDITRLSDKVVNVLGVDAGK